MEGKNSPLLLNEPRNIELSGNDRRQHMLITGVPSTGVSAYVIDLMLQDISTGTPLIVFDQYGDIVERILKQVSEDQLQHAAYIDIGNREYPVGLNIFKAESVDEKTEIANTVINMLYALYDSNRTGIIGPRFDYAVRNAIATILYEEKSTFIELVRCLNDSEYVNKILPKVTDPMVKNYWTKQIAQTSDFHKSEVLDYIISKFGRLVSDPKIRNIVGQPDTSINFAELLETKKIMLFDFSKFANDREAMQIVSEIVLWKFTKAIEKGNFSNQSISFYIDEVGEYSGSNILALLRISRQYGVNLTLVTQRLSDIEPVLQKKLLRVGTLISFRVSTADALILAPEFHKNITIDHLCMLKKYHTTIKTLNAGNPVVYEHVDHTVNGYEQKDKSGREIEKIKIEKAKEYGKQLAQVKEELMTRMA